MNRLRFLLVFPVFMVACSTATTHSIKTENRNPDWQPIALKNIAVVAVTDDRAERVSSESVFAEELTAKAVDASPTFDFIPRLSSLDTEEEARRAFDGKDFDAILTIGIIESRDQYQYEDYYSTYGWMILLGADSRQARGVANLKDVSDYYGQGKLTLDIGLWDADTLEPIWNATTDSYEFGRGAQGVQNLADFMITTLAERGFIKPYRR